MLIGRPSNDQLLRLGAPFTAIGSWTAWYNRASVIRDFDDRNFPKQGASAGSWLLIRGTLQVLARLSLVVTTHA